MKQLILVRHGESEWNKLNLFTGWTDVDLTEAGMQEAYEAGKLLKEEGYRPELCFIQSSTARPRSPSRVYASISMP